MTALPASTPTLHAPASRTLWEAALRRLSREGRRRSPQIWRESRMLLESTRLFRDPVAKGVGFPRGDGRPVFLIPGYLAGDVSLVPLARALRRADYRTKLAGMRLNIGCATELLAPIEERL